MTRLPLRLAWRRWRLRNQAVPAYGRPLTDAEALAFAVARNRYGDEEGTRQIAAHEQATELLAADLYRGGGA